MNHRQKLVELRDECREDAKKVSFSLWLEGIANDIDAILAEWHPEAKVMPREADDIGLEAGRKAVEDTLVEWRDRRISEIGRGNGCVIWERDGTKSDVIRFGPETALRIGYRALFDAYNPEDER